MSDLVIVAAIGAIPASIAAVGVIMANRKIAVVHNAVNCGLAAKAEIASLKEELRVLKGRP